MNISQLSLSQKAKKVKEYFIESGLSPLVAHILAQRGMETLEQVNYDYKIKSVFALKGIEIMPKLLLWPTMTVMVRQAVQLPYKDCKN